MSDITTEPETASAATAPFFPPKNSGRGGARPGAGRRKGSAAWLERQRDPEAYDNEWRARRGLPPKPLAPPASPGKQPVLDRPATPATEPPKKSGRGGKRPGAGRKRSVLGNPWFLQPETAPVAPVLDDVNWLLALV